MVSSSRGSPLVAGDPIPEQSCGAAAILAQERKSPRWRSAARPGWYSRNDEPFPRYGGWRGGLRIKGRRGAPQ
jgi:hypothetical protein